MKPWPKCGWKKMMNADAVMDTSAIAALAFLEPGADVVRERLRRDRCVMHAVNLSEACFTLPRKRPDRFDFRSARAWLDSIGIFPMYGFDESWLAAVSSIRLSARALNFGDGVAVALASALGVPLVTAEKAFAGAEGFARVELIR